VTITRPRKARILEKAGLRYVAGWLPQKQAGEVLQQIKESEALVKSAIPKVPK